MGIRSIPFFKGKKGWQMAGGGQDSGGGSGYVLPTASTSTLGGVKIDGTSITISDGVISAGSYTLPTASTETLGGVKIDGTSITISDGVISAESYTLPTASTSTLGGVKVDGTSITIDDGVISSTGGGFQVASNAGAHNSVYRGQSLGASVTSEQYASIKAGSFDNMFIGDYWTIGEVNYRIAAFDYWLRTGDTECTDHHVVLVPDTCIGENQKMNDSNITTGGYVGSKMYTTNLASAKSAITSAFGSAHILSHRELLSNTVDSSGNASSWDWYDSDIELMNEQMVYGGPCGSKPEASSFNYNMGVDKSQLPLFALEPSRITNRAHWWLRSVVSATHFAGVGNGGYAVSDNASTASGVRPVFAIYDPIV